MKIEKILEGKRAGRIQKVGIMQVIPLFYQSEDLINRKIATPKEAMRMSTSNYGTMCFNNEDSGKTLITPNHMGVMTKLKAQDHAMSKTGVVKPGSTASYDSAMCIESSQPGDIPLDSYEYIVLPYSLRYKVASMSHKKGYERLWNDIDKFNREMGISTGRSHLSDFYEKHNDKLQEFIAQFECLPDQIGAIVLIDNKVVGVEVAPSPDYWQDVWSPLIRSCYGSETIKRLLKNKITKKPSLIDSNITQAVSLDELEEAVVRLESSERTTSEAIVKEIMNQKLNVTQDQKSNGYLVNDVYNSNYIGQIVMEDDFVVYASIIANASKMLKRNTLAF